MTNDEFYDLYLQARKRRELEALRRWNEENSWSQCLVNLAGGIAAMAVLLLVGNWVIRAGMWVWALVS